MLIKENRLREVLPDVDYGDHYILIKASPELKLTFQIKSLVYKAILKEIQLILRISKDCDLSKKLEEFQKKNEKYFKIERY